MSAPPHPLPTVFFGPQPFSAGLIVFDKDGTLLDFAGTWRPKFLAGVDRLLAHFPSAPGLKSALFRTLGYDPAQGTFSVYAPFATATSEAIIYVIATVLFQHAQPGHSWDACEQLVRAEFVPMFADTTDLVAAADLPALFSSLHESGVAIGILTSDDRAPTEATLGHFGIEKFVGFVACGDDAYPHKPAPDALLGACAHAGVPPERTAIVGDAITDLRTGSAAGVGLRVGVLTGSGSREELAPWADVVLASIGEIRVG